MAKQTFTTGQVLTAAQMTSLQQTAMGGGSATAKTVSYTLVAADAGTVVAMNSGSATTVTVNTGLFAAGDTVQIQNLGAGVFTVTAGTATVSTSTSLSLNQYDSGTLYFSTTGVAIWTGISNPGDITAVNTSVSSGLSGGATSGAVDLSLLLNFNAQTGITYTLVASDLNKLVTTSNASAVVVTVPPSVFSAGQQINVQSIGVGLTSFVGGSGVTITSTGAASAAPILRARYSACTIICTASNVFTVVGDLS